MRIPMASLLTLTLTAVSGAGTAATQTEAATPPNEGIAAHTRAIRPTPLQQNLIDALLCRVEPLSVLDDLVARGSDFSAGYAATAWGQEVEYRRVVILRDPLRLADASAQAIVGEVASSENFGGIVHARFTGDYLKVVDALELQPSTSEIPIGRYERTIANDPDNPCPMTIGLTPDDDGSFLLGCGWCNG